MKIAIPTANEMLCLHFGHCEKFVIFDVDTKTKKILGKVETVPPPHEPGVIPKWLNEQKVNAIIAGGMGMRAQQFFTEFGIQVIVGASSEKPQTVVEAWLNGTLSTGQNVCDH
jgi:predicted Fe-Mo cluster-binding NifX family protein